MPLLLQITKPAIIGPILVTQTSKTATIPKNTTKYLTDLSIQFVSALVSSFSNLCIIIEVLKIGELLKLK